VLIVSPYNKLNEHWRDEIKLARNKSVEVTLVARQDEDLPDESWLLNRRSKSSKGAMAPL
jgi:hypothetical protein